MSEVKQELWGYSDVSVLGIVQQPTHIIGTSVPGTGVVEGCMVSQPFFGINCIPPRSCFL